MRLSNPLLLASLGALLAAASCTLITDVDRSKIPDGQAGSPGTTGGDGNMMPQGGEPSVGGNGTGATGGESEGGTGQGGTGAVDGGAGGTGGVPGGDAGAGGVPPEGGAGGAPGANAGAGGA